MYQPVTKKSTCSICRILWNVSVDDRDSRTFLALFSQSLNPVNPCNRNSTSLCHINICFCSRFTCHYAMHLSYHTTDDHSLVKCCNRNWFHFIFINFTSNHKKKTLPYTLEWSVTADHSSLRVRFCIGQLLLFSNTTTLSKMPFRINPPSAQFSFDSPPTAFWSRSNPATSLDTNLSFKVGFPSKIKPSLLQMERLQLLWETNLKFYCIRQRDWNFKKF